ncbi:MAG: hypothetical protein RL220_1911 [Bacteroidota bacterium]|jgi:hypothetical protein
MGKHITRSSILLTIIFVFALGSCRKEESLNFTIQGKILNARSGEPLSGAHVEVRQQVVENGVFSAIYSEAAETLTAPDGGYNLTWARENIAGLRLLIDKEQYISRQLDLSVSAVESGDVYTLHSSLYPEAFVTVHISNTASANPSDQFSFRYDDAQFDCTCCNEDWKIFTGSDTDTTFTCRLYGDTWLKYVQQITTIEADTLIVDSIWCPAFQDTPLDLTY